MPDGIHCQLIMQGQVLGEAAHNLLHVSGTLGGKTAFTLA
jgi:hypothetical protein